VSQLPSRFSDTPGSPTTRPAFEACSVSTDAVPVTTTFHTLQTFQSYFHGWLFKNPVTNLATLPACMNYSHADSTVVYLAEHPRYIGIAEQLGVFHPQISDKVFEEKAIKVIERHLSLHGDIRRFVAKDPTRQDGWRYLTGETNIAEWDGIWEGPDEHIYFLETKHFVDGNKIVQVDQKLEKSLKFLGKSTQMATTYVAGKYWSTESGAVDHARKLGFGIVEENGTDLEVEDPVGGRQVRQNNGKQVMVEGKKRGRPRKVKP